MILKLESVASFELFGVRAPKPMDNVAQAIVGRKDALKLFRRRRGVGKVNYKRRPAISSSGTAAVGFDRMTSRAAKALDWATEIESSSAFASKYGSVEAPIVNAARASEITCGEGTALIM
eukprot:CAMPEP_0171624538 /NCGR_PEP_ID=MMETSP0990-20121206/18687_2 /TAXON_ID=483369 /ORGANISM="non described non described, Strain CCMP2098" /LENGTH=119 /DNA_ID=CAMNT_0012191123 /DNA_START=537 /DNA_END=897 /DNA_ORIENTATION=-